MFTEPLPSNNGSDTQTDGRGFMKYPVEIDSLAMICIPSFMKIGSGIQNLMGSGYTQTGWRSHRRILGK
jgi:hypothetical protein